VTTSTKRPMLSPNLGGMKMLDAKRDPLSGTQRIELAVLRSEIASARTLLDLVEQHLPYASSKESTTDSLATQVAEELLRVARDLVLCARRIAPSLTAAREADTEHAA
jgi:hypothetical protein